MTITNGVSVNSHSEIERANSPDIMLGAYLMSHLRQHCENCGTLQTPQWRKGWFSEVLNHSVLLCNACGLKYHKNQFCPYCKYVYGKEQKISNVWLTCEHCARWVHVECETKYGGNQNRMPYACPDCRNGTPPGTIHTPHDAIVRPPPQSIGTVAISELELEDKMERAERVEREERDDFMDLVIDEETMDTPHIIPSTLNLV